MPRLINPTLINVPLSDPSWLIIDEADTANKKKSATDFKCYFFTK